MLTDDIAVLDQHCHGVRTADLDRRGVESLLTEAPDPHGDPFDSLLGIAVRRWCAPVLGLAPHAEPEAYLERRAELGWQDVTRRMLRASGARMWLLDTGLRSAALTGVAEFAALGAGEGREVIRLEAIAEDVLARAGPVTGLRGEIEAAIWSRTERAAGLKSVAAYRSGLEVPGTPPSAVEIRSALSRWIHAGGRLTEPALVSWLMHLGAEVGSQRGIPLQVHTGFGDPDLHLGRSDPLLLTEFLRATQHSGVVVVLLHCWPYHRNAGFLAHVFPHVLVDLGLTLPYAGARSGAVLAETFELAPFGAVCFSSDGHGLPELHYLGAMLWRHHFGKLVDQWIADDEITTPDAERVVSGMAAHNAARAYGISWPATS